MTIRLVNIDGKAGGIKAIVYGGNGNAGGTEKTLPKFNGSITSVVGGNNLFDGTGGITIFRKPGKVGGAFSQFHMKRVQKEFSKWLGHQLEMNRDCDIANQHVVWIDTNKIGNSGLCLSMARNPAAALDTMLALLALHEHTFEYDAGVKAVRIARRLIKDGHADQANAAIAAFEQVYPEIAKQLRTELIGKFPETEFTVLDGQGILLNGNGAPGAIPTTQDEVVVVPGVNFGERKNGFPPSGEASRTNGKAPDAGIRIIEMPQQESAKEGAAAGPLAETIGIEAKNPWFFPKTVSRYKLRRFRSLLSKKRLGYGDYDKVALNYIRLCARGESGNADKEIQNAFLREIALGGELHVRKMAVLSVVASSTEEAANNAMSSILALARGKRTERALRTGLILAGQLAEDGHTLGALKARRKACSYSGANRDVISQAAGSVLASLLERELESISSGSFGSGIKAAKSLLSTARGYQPNFEDVSSALELSGKLAGAGLVKESLSLRRKALKLSETFSQAQKGEVAGLSQAILDACSKSVGSMKPTSEQAAALASVAGGLIRSHGEDAPISGEIALSAKISRKVAGFGHLNLAVRVRKKALSAGNAQAISDAEAAFEAAAKAALAAMRAGYGMEEAEKVVAFLTTKPRGGQPDFLFLVAALKLSVELAKSGRCEPAFKACKRALSYQGQGKKAISEGISEVVLAVQKSVPKIPDPVKARKLAESLIPRKKDMLPQDYNSMSLAIDIANALGMAGHALHSAEISSKVFDKVNKAA